MRGAGGMDALDFGDFEGRRLVRANELFAAQGRHAFLVFDGR
jgi:hypothetical protein